MTGKSTFKAHFRRRREGKTNYKKRKAMLSSGLPRLVARKSNKYIIVQLIEAGPKGDKTLVHVNSRQLQGLGWKAGKKNIPASYLAGLLAGKRAVGKGIEKAVLDIGFSTPVHGSFWAAVLKGALDAGLQVNADQAALPGEERVNGKHIEQFAAKLGGKAAERFSGYAKEKVDAKEIGKMFGLVKEKILKEKGKEGG